MILYCLTFWDTLIILCIITRKQKGTLFMPQGQNYGVEEENDKAQILDVESKQGERVRRTEKDAIQGENQNVRKLQKDKNGKGKKKKPSFLSDLLGLLLKIGMIVLAFYVLTTYLFGVYRNISADMKPNVKDGDLAFFYRLDKKYASGDIVVINHNGQQQVQRVIAVGGDEVNIDEETLRVNGYIQMNLEDIYTSGKTVRYEEGISFPITLGPDEIFVLGDNREYSTDSRIYGPVKIEDTLGKVMMIIRMRNF